MKIDSKDITLYLVLPMLAVLLAFVIWHKALVHQVDKLPDIPGAKN